MNVIQQKPQSQGQWGGSSRKRKPKSHRHLSYLKIFNMQNNNSGMNPAQQDITCEGNSSRRTQMLSKFFQKDERIVSESAGQSYGPFFLQIPAPKFESNESPLIQESMEIRTLSPAEMECKLVEVQKILRCPGCLERLRPPVVCCLNGHAICGPCKTLYLTRGNNSKCPSCGERINYAFQCTLIDNLVHNFMFHCKFLRSGCSFSSFSDNLNEHERICDYKDICCMLIKNGEICYRSIAISEYLKHCQIHHTSNFSSGFKLGHPCELILPKKSSLERNFIYYRVLKDEKMNVCFIEKTNYDEPNKSYLISVHFMGKRSEASNYVYTIDILKGQYVKQLTYSNECLPSMSSVDVERSDIFTLLDRNGSFAMHGLKYNLTVQRNEFFDAIANATIAVLKPENVQSPDGATVF